MKSCHLQRQEQGKLKEKKGSETKYEDMFSVKCYFLMSETGKKQTNYKTFLLKIYYF